MYCNNNRLDGGPGIERTREPQNKQHETGINGSMANNRKTRWKEKARAEI
jgi:hypothetical protein